MAGEAVASPMRLATAPGRLARPAPPGNDDPCEERRTIPVGLPRRPREAFERGLRRVVRIPRSPFGRRGTDNGEHGPGPEIPRGAPQGERARRRVTQDVSTAHRAGWPDMRHIDRSHGLPVVRNERKAGSFARVCRSMRRPHAGHGVPIWVRRRHPSATGAPHAPREGAAKCEERSE